MSATSKLRETETDLFSVKAAFDVSPSFPVLDFVQIISSLSMKQGGHAFGCFLKHNFFKFWNNFFVFSDLKWRERNKQVEEMEEQDYHLLDSRITVEAEEVEGEEEVEEVRSEAEQNLKVTHQTH